MRSVGQHSGGPQWGGIPALLFPARGPRAQVGGRQRPGWGSLPQEAQPARRRDSLLEQRPPGALKPDGSVWGQEVPAFSDDLHGGPGRSSLCLRVSHLGDGDKWVPGGASGRQGKRTSSWIPLQPAPQARNLGIILPSRAAPLYPLSRIHRTTLRYFHFAPGPQSPCCS